MAGVDGLAAARTLLSFRNIATGMCLHYVWQAYKAHGARASGSWGTAYLAWLDTPGKHYGDWNPPAGVPVWFGPRAGSAAGDVVISLGGGRVACTDYPEWGVVGSCTIAERQRQIGRPYLGWTETILGAEIDYDRGGSAAGAESIPLPPVIDYALLRRQKGDEMYLKGTSNSEVYERFTDANGSPALRLCGPAEASYAIVGGLVVTGDDETLMMLARETGYGREILPNVAGGGLRVIVKQAPEITTTYALYGPGYWAETVDPDLANAWARVYANAENVTYEEWDHRKAIAAGGVVTA